MGSVMDRVEELLLEVDYPANKETLLGEAQRRGADADALGALRGLPPVDYGSREEVLRSIDVSAAEQAGQTMAEKGRQGRDDAHREVAEHMRDVEPSPIEREVGFNKGS